MRVDIKRRCIVCFTQDIKNANAMRDMGHPSPRIVHYQVTIDPDRQSPDGMFIRFGSGGDGRGDGDEITGWMGLNDLTVKSVLAIWDDATQEFKDCNTAVQEAA